MNIPCISWGWMIIYMIGVAIIIGGLTAAVFGLQISGYIVSAFNAAIFLIWVYGFVREDCMFDPASGSYISKPVGY